MKKSIYGYIIVLFSILLSAIVIIQFLRLDYGHRLIPSKTYEARTFETLAGETRSLSGEKLQIYLHQNEDRLSESILTNFTYALDYAKLPYTRISADEIAALQPSPYTVLVLGGENTASWPYETIERFVEAGGRLYIAGRFIDAKWADLVGVEDFGDYLDGVNGLEFEQELFPGYVNLSQDSELFIHSIADVKLEQSSDVMITANKEPILWKAPYGKGEVMYWNTTSLADKNSRGLMIQALSTLFPAFVTQQAGIKVVHFDDFPAPVPGNSNPVIKDAYNLSIKDFFSEIWWRDMKQIAADHDVMYTGFLIGSYKATNEETVEQLNKKIREPMLEYGRGLLQLNGEVGLHGFNHQPLVSGDETMDPELGYTRWKDEEQMRSAVDRVVETFDYYLPEEQIRSYVPPSNIIGTSGLSVLNDVFPEGLIIAGLYSGDTSKGSYVQEFGPDPVNPNLYNFPRVSSGYNETTDETFVVADAVANFGLVSHFIHPDDVLDVYRSKGRSWAAMKDSFEGMFETIHATYPHLEALTQYDAYQKYKLYQQAEIEVAYTEDTIEINSRSVVTPSTMLVRLQPGMSLETGTFAFGTVRTFGDSGTLYQVELTDTYARLTMKEEGL
ncbi:polysaccharide deacetylase family protein [Exiguobacterium sp. S17]|nr:polysaccharide deacetylase family protein [Exiguobacterium sp. S17]